MPSDFDEMAGYHNRLAAHFQALAQEARGRGSRNEAEFLTAQAVRYAAAADEQKRAMSRQPGSAGANQVSEPWPPPQPPPSLAATRFLAVLHGIHRFVFRRKAPFNGVSLH
jgi:hypothetical protein